MKLPIVYHPDYSPSFDASHRFPMEKFSLLFRHLNDIGLLAKCELFQPDIAPNSLIELAHAPDYVQAYRDNTLTTKEMRRIGLPWTPGVMQRTFRAVGGSVLTTQLALERGIAAHLAGGTHHAHHRFGSGFCIFNDLAICAQYALKQPHINRVMIIDVDVHQGDGTARILADNPNAITVSVHCKQNFPARKAKSDHDLEVEYRTGDAAYLQLIKQNIPYLLALYQPDLVIYDAGADPHEDDALGLLNLTSEGLFERDYFVLSECVNRSIPVACVIGGGYIKNRHQLAAVHSIIHQAAYKVFEENL